MRISPQNYLTKSSKNAKSVFLHRVKHQKVRFFTGLNTKSVFFHWAKHKPMMLLQL